MPNARRVVITGVGVVSPYGVGVQCLWDGMICGKSAIRPINLPNLGNIPVKIAGQVPESGENCFDWSTVTKFEQRQSSRATIFGLTAAEEAVRDSGLTNLGTVSESDDSASGHLTETYSESSDQTASCSSVGGAGDNAANSAFHEAIGVAIGAGMADLQDIHNTGSLLDQGKYSRISPYFVPRILTNMTAGRVAMRFRLRGPNHSVSAACTTGLHSIGDGAGFIRKGWADVMLCGGVDACVTPIGLAGFSRLRALSTNFDSQPDPASRPFDKRRDGFVMSEGAAVLVLEEFEQAKRRGARIYAEVLGYGMSGDGFHLTSPDDKGTGAELCMRRALNDAEVAPDMVGYVNAHATSTPLGDVAECRAIGRVFQGSDNSEKVSVSSSKGHFGHLLGGSGAIESVVTTAFRRGHDGYRKPGVAPGWAMGPA